jgi:hypothetical protein
MDTGEKNMAGMITTANIPNGNMKDERRASIMNDLERRAKDLDAEPDTNIYRKALQKDKWRELYYEAMERLKATQQPLDCEGPLLGEQGKVDIRRFTCKGFYDKTPAGLDSPSHNAYPAGDGT